MLDADNEIARSLGRIEGKVDMIITQINKDDARLASVEKKVWIGSGLSALVGVYLAKLGLPFLPTL